MYQLKCLELFLSILFLLQEPYKAINRLAIKCSLSGISSTTDKSINKTAVERFINFVADKNITFVFKEKELDFYKDECIINQTNVPFELVKEGNKVEFIQ